MNENKNIHSEIIESPIIGLVGDKGSGKTLFLRALAQEFHNEKLNVYANFQIFGIDYTHINFTYLADLPDNLRDGVILLDEAQMGLDAYKWYDKQSTKLSKLFTQLRKRNLEIVYSTQRWPTVNYRVRDITDYIFAFEAGRDSEDHLIKGTSLISISNRSRATRADPAYKQLIFDGRKYFGMYNTDEIIENE